MQTSEIELSDQQVSAIRTIAQQTGKTEHEILSQAIAQFISQFAISNRQTLLQKARGMWHDRALSDLTAYRNEFDRDNAPE
ncbi:CopG family transcriptional regulator [Stenomitos frigidus]|uniref:CopG family transcriptional regulator n=1 Tax=Stenomitos frigidus ULC18 TaxID=2107698 RepID=A0A2T1EGI5_9CYAN|nr:CopG family transcriptional regulator [Stenomitos frigidus]PSB31872.1 CopG family transcriptional regulator [Stenomitos frigidus ULC18]